MTQTAPPLSPELFDLEKGILWVMHCAEGPVPLSAVDASADFLRRETRPWTLRWNDDFVGIPRGTREAAAALLGGRAEDVSLLPSTSTGLATVAHGVDWRPGDEVVLPLGEFPSNYWPWRALQPQGVSVREVPLWDGHRGGAAAWESTAPTAAANPESRLLDALSPRTRILSVSWVRFQDGLVLDLARLAAGCAERGVDLVVDGIQGAGTLVPRLDGVAAFATAGHKGLLAPQGIGFLWTAAGFRRRLQPFGTWLSVDDATDFSRPSTDFERDWNEDGSRFEQGLPNLLSCVFLRESMKLIHDVGVERIAAHVGGLRRELVAGLRETAAWRGEANRLAALDAAGRLGSIVSLHHAGRGYPGLDRLLKRGFGRGIYASVREGYLRVALHGWHTSCDVGRVLEWLAAGDP